MNILLDTHAVLWSLTSDPRLTPQAREMILSPDNVVCFSVVSLWEIAIKNQKSPETTQQPDAPLVGDHFQRQYHEDCHGKGDTKIGIERGDISPKPTGPFLVFGRHRN